MTFVSIDRDCTELLMMLWGNSGGGVNVDDGRRWDKQRMVRAQIFPL